MCSQHDLGPVMGYQRLDERDVSTEGSPDSGDKPSKFRQTPESWEDMKISLKLYVVNFLTDMLYSCPLVPPMT